MELLHESQPVRVCASVVRGALSPSYRGPGTVPLGCVAVYMIRSVPDYDFVLFCIVRHDSVTLLLSLCPGWNAFSWELNQRSLFQDHSATINTSTHSYLVQLQQ